MNLEKRISVDVYLQRMHEALETAYKYATWVDEMEEETDEAPTAEHAAKDGAGE